LGGWDGELEVERFGRYGWGKGFGVLRCAQDDSKSKRGKSKGQGQRARAKEVEQRANTKANTKGKNKRGKNKLANTKEANTKEANTKGKNKVAGSRWRERSGGNGAAGTERWGMERQGEG
jgi:hypothetical protein